MKKNSLRMVLFVSLPLLFNNFVSAKEDKSDNNRPYFLDHLNIDEIKGLEQTEILSETISKNDHLLTSLNLVKVKKISEEEDLALRISTEKNTVFRLGFQALQAMEKKEKLSSNLDDLKISRSDIIEKKRDLIESIPPKNKLLNEVENRHIKSAVKKNRWFRLNNNLNKEQKKIDRRISVLQKEMMKASKLSKTISNEFEKHMNLLNELMA